MLSAGGKRQGVTVLLAQIVMGCLWKQTLGERAH